MNLGKNDLLLLGPCQSIPRKGGSPDSSTEGRDLGEQVLADRGGVTPSLLFVFVFFF